MEFKKDHSEYRFPPNFLARIEGVNQASMVPKFEINDRGGEEWVASWPQNKDRAERESSMVSDRVDYGAEKEVFTFPEERQQPNDRVLLARSLIG